jgi:hypothetical protein
MSSNPPTDLHAALTELTTLLHHRVTVIEDHAWRDLDASSHLGALQEISGKITAWAIAHRTEVDPQLRHYLANSSFQKALAHAESLTESSRQG